MTKGRINYIYKDIDNYRIRQKREAKANTELLNEFKKIQAGLQEKAQQNINNYMVKLFFGEYEL